jgi:hypothetical protein
MILAALSGAYLAREAITRRFADAELAARKIDAQYQIKSIGMRMQRFEHVVLGNPLSPDLTADWIEVQLGLGLSGVGVTTLRAGGLRLRGRLQGDTVSFGVIDRFLPKPSGKPFALPDLELDLTDAVIALDTDYGAVRARVAGKGNIASGFAGRLDVDAPQLRIGQVEAVGTAARLTVGTQRRRIEFSGPLFADRLQVAGNIMRGSSVTVKVSSSEAFDDVSASWLGTVNVEKLLYGEARQVRGEGKLKVEGRSARLTARLQLDGLRPGARVQARLASAIPDGAGTPVEPLVRQLRRALNGLERGSVATIPVEYRTTEGRSALLVGPPTLVSGSGAGLIGSGRGFVIPLDKGRTTFDGEFAISGGGFPGGSIRLTRIDDIWTGKARFKSFGADGARIAFAPVDLRYDSKGLTLNTSALIDGPIGGGRIAGLSLPIALRPQRDPFAGCLVSRFRSLEIGNLRLAPAALGACITGKEARIEAPRLSGRLGSSPIQIAAQAARIGFSHGTFAIEGAAVRLGSAEQLSQVELDSLRGTFGDGHVNGHFTGGTGTIGNVPLKISEGAGDWQFVSGELRVTGGLRVADTVADPRFNPLVSDNFSLRLVDGRITAEGLLREPKSGGAVAEIHIVHNLTPGTGSATLDVTDLVFGKKLQPEMLTNTTLGVIANVVGSIAGHGIIRWTPDGVASAGSFRTDSLDLAAAFGPVTGLKGEIALSDLLGLETGPGQTVGIASINPGIAVLDGNIRYQLLPGQKVRIEGGRWPFAGGWLILEPTMFDLTEAAERRLTFRVEGLDAGQFINQLQFENIDATGIYDGTLPMIFDQQGGRIEGGRLVARGGGTLAYVGEISNENLGTMGRVAFDALKSIRYDRLSIDLAGPLDGDVVTRISFAGVNQAPISGVRAKLPIPIRVTGLTNFPFIFNVTITAPFRKLFDMSRTISDPSFLIERLNPDLQRIGPAKTIQPPESETVR